MRADTHAVPTSPIPLAEGDTLPEWRFGPLTRTDIVRYAGASGDFNPIHHDEPLAIAAGLPSVFGIGMMHAGMLGQRLSAWVGPHNICAFSVRFEGQVWPDDVLTFSGTVIEVESSTHEVSLAHVELSVARQDGEQVLSGKASVSTAPHEARSDGGG
ncbi:acyl dehydratase [Tamaricihabitans halophyticus]|uniref:Acyl dehydratase n=1 Tax=Tamaricihabitans halophyticus TaxID=1262583 RepID=A0A4R2Q4C4_9PSEU|nr:MaoC/PaaZ C-terminal domain-containing protein [Tamaricihabitans halophyticus]TCP42608.1 acyl dehydratase [Tamaricihabitans halophyticus]